MNFFESQDRARRNTVQLVLLFVLAVVTLIAMTNLLVMVVFGYIDSQQMQEGGTLLQQIDWQTFIAVSVGVSVVVVVGSLYKIMTLSAGGKAVAEALGGRLIPQNTDDPKHRKLLNVVEEMAIASGTPAPPVYLLVDEPGINAFAAGFSPRDAVIGVTQGTIDQLSRDQLQGVIAHEFSHIFNGDMRLNIRLMGVLHGILIIGIIGYYILYSTSFSRHSRSNDKGAGGILALAIGLMVIGFAGTFFGSMIKAAVSRKREYLADASAVQFTRNPDGIAGALKRIGGLEFGSKVENPGASEVSHAFFAQSLSGFMQSLSATHPPLAKRILRLDPQWDGKFDTSREVDSPQNEEGTGKSESMTREELAKKVATVVTGAAMADVAQAIEQIGQPQQETIRYAHLLISELPAVIKEAAREPYGARAVIYSLVLDPEQEVRDKQLDHLKRHADPDVFVLTHKLIPEMDGLDIKYRLPLIDIAIPALKQMSINQYKLFKKNLVALIEMDSRIDLLEWSLQKIIFNHLDGQFFKLEPIKTRYSQPRQLKKEVGLILSVMAYAGQQNQGDAERAFAAATTTLDFGGLQLVPNHAISLSGLDRALQKLARLKPLAKPPLLKACAASVTQDQIISPVEVELLRTFADVLDCPMPPIIP
ncbi:MAG: M48 family metallopeptidase [Gammaproteobacteria bacterium]|nr:M48 family metallopeptidase [Gammaproteobacteria bacterium]